MFPFRTHKALLATASLISCGLMPTSQAAAQDGDGGLTVQPGQTVIVQPLAMLFTEKADFKAYQDFYGGHSTRAEAEAYGLRLTRRGKAVQRKQAAVATVLSQDKVTHQVQVRIGDADPEWVEGRKLDPYSFQRIKQCLDWKQLIEPGP